MGSGGFGWEYGSRPQTGAPDGVWLTGDDVLALLPAWTEPLKYLVKIIPLSYIPTAELCAHLPEYYGEPTAQDLIDALFDPGKHRAIALSLLSFGWKNKWAEYCEYIPAPDPILEPTPDPPLPPEEPVNPGLPDPPDPPPDGPGENWVTLATIMARLFVIENMVWYNEALLRWICDNTQTLEWNAGDTREITGTGHAILSPADGYIVTITSYPEWLGHAGSAKEVFFDAGFFSYGRLDGTTASFRLTRLQHLFYPTGIHPHQVNWQLAPGVTATIQAVLRKPYPDGPARTAFVLPG